jgi:hypothetical protein
MLRSQFRSSVVAWRSMMIVASVVVFGSWVTDSLFVDPDDLQFLYTVVVTFYALAVLLLAGVLVLITWPWRRTHPLVDRIVKADLLAATVVGGVAWVASLVSLLRL